jgi:hypothetical protein
MSAGGVAARDTIGSVTATPKTLAFGKVAVGSTSTLSFWLTNDTKAPLLITALLSGNASGDFAYLPTGTTNDCFAYVVNGTLLYPGESCGNAVSFSPTTKGRQSGSMSFSFSDGVRTLSLTEAFSGSGS